MATKDKIVQLRNELFATLDDKLRDMPEWRAWRALGNAIQALNTPLPAPTPKAAPTLPLSQSPSTSAAPRRGRVRLEKSYAELAAEAFEATGMPVTTADMVTFISTRREVSADPAKAKINIQSALSRDEKFRSVPWRDGRAWWYVDRPVPKKETAGTSANS